MGTNYYLRKKPSQEELISLKEMIDKTANGTNFNEVISAVHLLYDEPDNKDMESIEGWGKLHIGKRSAGWKFDWCPNIVKLNLSYIDKDHNYVENYEYKLRYPLTKAGICEYIMRDDIIVIDEYDEVQDKEKFLEMAFNWCPDGWDSMHNDDPSDYPYNWSKEQEPYKELGFEFEADRQSDFFSDGLRFTIFEDFC